MGEYDVFLQMLWDYQWTKTRFELTQRLRNIFYFYTQGVSDIIIKLFHDVQLRAIRDGGEEVVDEALVHDVANNELAALTELTAAMRKMDYERTGRSADLAAYLRIDPHALTFARQLAQDGLVEIAEAEPEEEVVCIEGPAEAADEPQEVPTGPDAKTKRPRKSKSAVDVSAPDTAVPAITPVDDLDAALGE